jgi:hypothetical protein
MNNLIPPTLFGGCFVLVMVYAKRLQVAMFVRTTLRFRLDVVDMSAISDHANFQTILAKILVTL